MVLPLPVPPGSSESAVRFIGLSLYPKFFTDLDRAFPPKPGQGVDATRIERSPWAGWSLRIAQRTSRRDPPGWVAAAGVS